MTPAYLIPPVDLGGIAHVDIDLAFEIDATANMTQRETTIASIAAAVITREDGVSYDINTDLTVTDVVVISAGLKWTFTAKGNGNAAVYLIEFPLTLADGSIITRTFRLPVGIRIG